MYMKMERKKKQKKENHFINTIDEHNATWTFFLLLLVAVARPSQP